MRACYLILLSKGLGGATRPRSAQLRSYAALHPFEEGREQAEPWGDGQSLKNCVLRQKAGLRKAPINSQEFRQSHGPGFSLLGLGISEVILSSLVLRVGRQQARSISKAAEKGDVLHVQVRKDRSVKSFLQRNEKSGRQGSVMRKGQG